MTSRATSLALALGLLAGCRDEGSVAPRVYQVTPGAVPAYAGATLRVLGEGFFPVMGVSTLSGQAVVGSADFSVRLSPVSALDASCTPTTLTLRDVSWLGAGELRGVVPPESCAGEYDLQVIDPRGETSPVGPRVTLSPVWPDHLVVAPGTCAAEVTEPPAEAGATLGEKAPFTVRVVGPRGEPASAFPSELRTADQLGVDIALTVSPEDDLVAADLVTTTLQASAPVGAEDYRLVGPLNAEGCAELTLVGTSAGRARIAASSTALPGRGDASAADLVVLFQPAGDLELVFDVPEVVTATEAFPLSISIRDARTGETVSTADSCLDVRANDQELVVVAAGAASFGCQGGLLPMSAGRWDGQVRLDGARDQAFLLASTQHGVFGASGWFEVIAADASRVVVTAPGRVVAGEPFELSATVTDAAGNPVAVDPADVDAPSDLTGTLTCAQGPEAAAATVVWRGCTVTGVHDADVVTVRYSGGVVGHSAAFLAVAGGPASLSLTVPPEAQTAGRGFAIELEVLDAWGNRATGSSGTAMFSLGTGAVVYVSSDQVKGGDLNATATAYIAAEDVLKVIYGSLSTSAPLRIVAGAVDRFRVGRTSLDAVTAGESASLRVTALDAYDNTVTTYAPSGALSVTDSSTNTLSLASSVSFEEGVALVLPVMEIANPSETVTVTDPAGVEGSIGGIEVLPGPIAAFDILQEEAAYFIAEPFYIEFRAVDAFGNLIPDFGGTVYYTDLTGDLSPDASGPFEGGIRRERFRITEARQDDVITVSTVLPNGDTVSSSSQVFPVLSECQTGLSVDLALPNITAPDRGTMCLVKPLGVTSVDAVATVAGAQPQTLIKYIWSDGDDEFQTTPFDTHTFAVSTEGHYSVSVTAYELPTLCGVRDTFDLFVGRPSVPTGPLTLAPDKEILSAGSADGSERTTIRVTGVDCQGEPANQKTEITLLTSYGSIRGAADIAPARPGVQVNMVQGAADLTLSVGEQQQATVATVVAGTTSGSCFGSVEIPVVNDTLSPWVVDFGPTGRTLEAVQTAWVRFSQPMLPESILLNDFVTVTYYHDGEAHPLVADEDYVLAMDDDAEVLTFTFTGEGLSLQEGLVRVVLPSEDGGFNVEGANNKRLDGNWDGVSDPDDRFTFQFGAVVDGGRPNVLSCLPDPIVYTPAEYEPEDGDSAGVHIGVDLADDQSLNSWRLEVYDLSGRSVYEKYGLIPAEPSISTEIIWYGVSMDGPVVANGTYWFEVSAIDVSGNLSELACQGWVEIANPLDLSTL